ncbi:MAG: hypothetical protein A2990_03805 [Candidatus Doudnabacteria bacterium RIFCSPLOWO2_01_FULL_49_40]|nr:MAG: hypothetical protein A3B77_03420 [Candidatus Doudnabacteria bacterium RIFCSPHIGHO2_02_FULL_49_24]OGE96893.1 MAG: hypothetical protein A2990_03805 [Candidatus Doudnabacteria bacterium RIFCSPLOWO2_01_FULL_49_40]
MSQNLYALAILAHPDDEAFLLAGTCLKFAAEGKSVGVVCATRGEKGADRLNRALTEEQMAEIRTDEMESACRIIGCHCVKFGNYPDGSLDAVNFDQLTQEVAQEIEQYQPKIILTFGPEGISGHRDHITIGRAAEAATKQTRHTVEEIWLASIPASAIGQFNEHLTSRKVHHGHFKQQELLGVPDDQLLKIDITKYAKQKHEALKAHQSQYLPDFVLDFLQKYEYFEQIKL